MTEGREAARSLARQGLPPLPWASPTAVTWCSQAQPGGMKASNGHAREYLKPQVFTQPQLQLSIELDILGCWGWLCLKIVQSQEALWGN